MNVLWRVAAAAPWRAARLLALACVLLAGTPPVWAQEVPPGESVRTRPKPELDPIGVKLGAFLFFPSLDIAEFYDDNIFAAENDLDHDLITVIEPTLAVNSDWDNHALNASVDGKFGLHARSSDEDYRDINMKADGRLDVTGELLANGRVGYSIIHEDRSSTDDVGGSEPGEFTLFTAGADTTASFDDFSLTISGDFEAFNHDDTPSTVGPVNQDDRDRLHFDGFVRTGYNISPAYEAFLRFAGNFRNYDSPLDDNGENRDSGGFEINGGLTVGLQGITIGEFFVGYLSQRFADQTLEDISGLTGGVNVTWNVTTLTTVNGRFEHDIKETTSAGASGVFLTKVSAGIDHELLRNLILGGHASYAQDRFRGLNREDNTLALGVDAEYKAFRNLYLMLEYEYISRHSDAVGSDYRNNVVGMKVESQF